MCKDILPAYTRMCGALAVPTEGRRGHQLLWTGQSCEQPLQVLGTKPEPSAKQEALLTTEPVLQPH